MNAVAQHPVDLWSLLPLPMLMLDGAGRIIDANAEAQACFHIALRRMHGALPDELFEAHPLISDLTGRVQAGKPSVSVNDMRLRFRNRAPLTCRLQVQEVDGGFFLLFQPDEIPQLAHRPAGSEGHVRSVVGMSDMLAHEIKNPLAGITGAAQLIRMTADEGTRELTDLIVDECQRIVKLLSQVEEFGNLQPPELKAINLHDVLDRAVRSASLGFAQNIEIKREYDPSLPETGGDADKLVQVFLNLLKNAAEALQRDQGVSRDGPALIRIRSYYEPGLRRQLADGDSEALPLHIEITDNGGGIPEDMIGEIFEPFVSGRMNGTGLGLPLVSHIVEGHGGMISVTSEPGHTCFTVSMPRVRKAAMNNREGDI